MVNDSKKEEFTKIVDPDDRQNAGAKTSKGKHRMDSVRFSDCIS